MTASMRPFKLSVVASLVVTCASITTAFGQSSTNSANPAEPAASRPQPATAPAPDCRSPQRSALSRFWELESGSDCGTLGIRGYRPTSLSIIGSDGANLQPASSAPGHTAQTPTAYSPAETRIQLSVRTKIAQGLLTQSHPNPEARDSLWFGYTQQSYWQLFNSDLSRPFRTTDHEPEITYIYPTDAVLPGGWRLRYGGVSLVHQSNGQTLPLSRSWNRAVLMVGMEKGASLRVDAKLWQRLPEPAGDDDNPGIDDLIGRAELAAFWDVNPYNTVGATLRHGLTNADSGSIRLEWLKSFGDAPPSSSRTGLRFHVQFFSGYGDSLVDFNRKRNVLSIGLSLLDW